MTEDEKSPQPEISFREAVALYLLADGDARYLTPLIELFGDRPLRTISQRDIDFAALTILPDAAASTRDRQVYGPASAVLKFGAARGLCKYFRIRRPHGPKIETRLPSSDELDRFVKAAGPSLKRIAIFLLHTDISVGVALRLEWHQIDLAKRQLRLRPGCGEGERLISLHPRAVEMLARFLHRDGKVFRRPDGSPYQTTALRGGQLKTAFRGACLRAGVPPITPRTLRRVWVARQAVPDIEGRRNAA
jgi:integrase